jgi:hypothetical protein
MNIEEQILEELSEKMCSSIDFEILSDVLISTCGWHRVDLERFTDNKNAVDITNWCHQKIQGEWKRNGCHFIFEETGDAIMFTLKWK